MSAEPAVLNANTKQALSRFATVGLRACAHRFQSPPFPCHSPKTPRRLNVIHDVTCDTASSYVIDFRCVLDFGEGHAELPPSWKAQPFGEPRPYAFL